MKTKTKTRPEEEDYFGFLEDDEPAPTPERRKKKKKRGRDSAVRLATALPDELPVLTKDDLLASPAQEREDCDRHHLTTWLDLCLPAEHYHRSVREALAVRVMDEMSRSWGYHGIAPPFVPLEDQAAVWNLALHALGYPVPVHARVVLGPDRGRKKKE